MYSGTFKGQGCAKCPVNQWACDAQYRGSRCEVLRAKAGVDFDPDEACDLCRDVVYMYADIYIRKKERSGRVAIEYFKFCPQCGRKISKEDAHEK